MSSPPANASAAATAGCWFVPELTTLPIAARRCVVRNALNDASLELSSGEQAVLSACEGCSTLAEHAMRAAGKIGAPPEHHGAICELLERCARAGLLLALPDLLRRFGAAPGTVPTTLSAVVIRTADRPQLLARLLKSVEPLQTRGGTQRRWIVVDDSREPQNDRANRAAMDAHAALQTEHIGREQGDALAEALRREFPADSREIDWLLGVGAQGEPTYGRPLNHALLRLAGCRFVSLDDDVLLEPRRAALCETGFAVSDEPDELLWFDSEATLWKACPAITLDPVAAHERWLGLPLADAWVQAERDAGTLARMRMSGARIARIDAAARVLFTHNHACGDPGSSVLPLQLLTLPEFSLRWLENNPDASAYAFGQRINWRGQTRLRLAPHRVLNFTTMVGVDNSSLLPPAARSYRSEDLLFGIAAQSMYPASWVVDLPFGLPHLRAPAKRWLASTDPFPQEPLHVAYSYIEEHAPRIAAESAAKRLEVIGALLLDLAAASDRDLAAMLSRHAADAGSRTLFAIQTQLDSATLPARWKAALAPWLRSPALSLDAAALHARVLAPAKVRALLNAYGSAVLVWPRLWEFCRQRYR